MQDEKLKCCGNCKHLTHQATQLANLAKLKIPIENANWGFCEANKENFYKKQKCDAHESK